MNAFIETLEGMIVRNRSFFYNLSARVSEKIAEGLARVFNRIGLFLDKFKDLFVTLLVVVGKTIWALLRLAAFYLPAVLIMLFFPARLWVVIVALLWAIGITIIGLKNWQ